MKLFYVSPSIWPMVQYEADLIVQESKNYSGSIGVIACRSFRPDCSANVFRSKVVCKVCNNRSENLIKYLRKNIDQECNLIPLKTDIYSYPKNFIKNYFPKNSNLKLRELSRSVLSTRQTRYRQKGKRRWVYDKDADAYWNTHANALSTISSLLEKYLVDAFYVFNGRMVGYRSAYEYARDNNIVSFVYEHPIEVRNRIFILKNSLVHNFMQRSLQMKSFLDRMSKKQALICKIGNSILMNRTMPGDRVGEYNFSSGSFYSSTSNTNKNPIHEKFILITNSSEWETFGCKESVTNFFGDQVRAIQQTLRYFESYRPDIKFVLRVHPQYAFRDKETYLKILNKLSKFNNVEIVRSENKLSTYDLIKRCHFMITFYSYTGVEAVALGKKVIAVGPAAYQEFLPSCVPSAKEDFYSQISNLWDQVYPSSSQYELDCAAKFAFARRYFGMKTKNIAYSESGMSLVNNDGSIFNINGNFIGKISVFFVRVLEKMFEKDRRQSLGGYLINLASSSRSVTWAILRGTR